MNIYMNLGIPEKRVTFRTLWYEKQDKNRGLHPAFTSLDNWPFRGLFWLAKDLHEESVGFRSALEPTAQRLAETRNHVEHKYCKVHNDMWSGPESQAERMSRITDTLAYSIFREEMADIGMLMLKLARSGLIYLSLGIHVEERRRARKRPSGQRIAASPIMTWPDKWKR